MMRFSSKKVLCHIIVGLNVTSFLPIISFQCRKLDDINNSICGWLCHTFPSLSLSSFIHYNSLCCIPPPPPRPFWHVIHLEKLQPSARLLIDTTTTHYFSSLQLVLLQLWLCLAKLFATILKQYFINESYIECFKIKLSKFSQFVLKVYERRK